MRGCRAIDIRTPLAAWRMTSSCPHSLWDQTLCWNFRSRRASSRGPRDILNHSFFSESCSLFSGSHGSSATSTLVLLSTGSFTQKPV
ncbi:hypothetical protein BDV33DRAFT_163492 [Aspergillus novoparasiticus]|uniref:Uncharacterized protein n=1 Tax=Aspergillus novoparasiticus TaxID=986946 RepID=A0A5N6F7Q9_9EURO|nr:hypothetical protein BDV33DRAFT_163492 [Aspergillus novoparasiticus]